MRDGQKVATRPKLGRPFKEPPPQSAPTPPPPFMQNFPPTPIQEDNESIATTESSLTDVENFQENFIEDDQASTQSEEPQRPIRSTRNIPHPKYNDYVWSASSVQLDVINSSISTRRTTRPSPG